MDYSKYLPFGIAVPIIIKLFDVEILLKNGGYEFIWIFMFVHGIALITWCYVMSFKFKEASNS
jgi:hypothetical protein